MSFKPGDKVRFRARTQTSVQPMVVKKVEGEHVFLDWDHRPWLESNLISDDEWPPTVEARAKEDALPAIEKGVPMPMKKPDQRRERRPSKWPTFLKSLKVGDSFLAEYPAANTVKAHARSLGIPLVWRYEGKGPENMAQERIWRAEPYETDQPE